MNIGRNSLLVLSALLVLVSCASVTGSSNPNDTAKIPSSPIDTIFIDYTPSLQDFKYHVFRASKDGKSGWMNIEGEWIVSPEFDNEFKREWFEGVNICRKGGKYGAINYKNEIVIPFEHLYPPSDCSDGLILVMDSLNKEAYFSKTGVRMTEFKKIQPEFRNGFAIIRTNRKEFASYPRIDLENSKLHTQIYKGDFVVINTQFDTLLQFSNVPFLLDFGTLNNNRRTFFLYPNMGLHADIGISYGQYGYLDGKGNIAIKPAFRASDVFIPVTGGYVRDPDCPFNSNLSRVRELEDYYYIDTLGNKALEIQTNRERIYDVSQFNDFGVAGYRTSGGNANSSMIHLIDTKGAILHEALESDAPMSIGGTISNQPRNDLIPIYDNVNGVHRIYTPDFELFAALPLRDSSRSIGYQYRGVDDNFLNDKFVITQHINGYPGSHQRLIDKSGIARSSWFSFNSILSSNYSNFTLVDSASMTTTLYDFSKNKLFECDSCFFHYHHKLGLKGIYKVQLSNGNRIYVNYHGKVLSELFNTIEESIYNLSDQVETYNYFRHHKINAKENEFIKLFNGSIMHKRIIK